MADWLLELFSEEIPSPMQLQAEIQLARLVEEGLASEGLRFETVATGSGPRRLSLCVRGLALKQEDRIEERKGPRIQAPEAAIAGFLRATGLARENLIERDGLLFARIAKPGRPSSEILANLTESLIRNFAWPKSMRWGGGNLRWVRPLKRILCLFDGAVVPLELEGIKSGNLSEGHRFLGPEGPFEVEDYQDYKQKLKDHYVLDRIDRQSGIRDGLDALCKGHDPELKWIQDEALLNEVIGLVEWPVPLLGRIEARFLTLPPEVIRTTMRTHQKYFAVQYKDETASALAPYFLVVANMIGSDGGQKIIQGNERVLTARLSDAAFFWAEDRKILLSSRLDALKSVTFHTKLGTVFQRVERIKALAQLIAPHIKGADPKAALTAAELCKADLTTAMVGEFPELQGVMGGYYARGLVDDPIADAIRDHYKPLGRRDDVPTAPTTIALALADKFELLQSFFAIGEKPTGSKDPYGLRRAALGIVRIIDHNHLEDLDIKALLRKSVTSDDVSLEILAFLKDRLKGLLKDEGFSYDLVEAVLSTEEANLFVILQKLQALADLKSSKAGVFSNLLSGYFRVANVLKAEEKKAALPDGDYRPDAGDHSLKGDVQPLKGDVQQGLYQAFLKTKSDLLAVAEEKNVPKHQFHLVLESLAALQPPIDAFFEKVLINDPEADIRSNRLRLLQQIRSLYSQFADLSKIVA